jgi:hypothetical protein
VRFVAVRWPAGASMGFVAGISNNFDLSARLLFNFDCHVFDRQILAKTEKTKLGHSRKTEFLGEIGLPV